MFSMSGQLSSSELYLKGELRSAGQSAEWDLRQDPFWRIAQKLLRRATKNPGLATGAGEEQFRAGSRSCCTKKCPAIPPPCCGTSSRRHSMAVYSFPVGCPGGEGAIREDRSPDDAGSWTLHPPSLSTQRLDCAMSSSRASVTSARPSVSFLSCP